jgi:hypothetical protein
VFTTTQVIEYAVRGGMFVQGYYSRLEIVGVHSSPSGPKETGMPRVKLAEPKLAPWNRI